MCWLLEIKSFMYFSAITALLFFPVFFPGSALLFLWWLNGGHDGIWLEERVEHHGRGSTPVNNFSYSHSIDPPVSSPTKF